MRRSLRLMKRWRYLIPRWTLRSSAVGDAVFFERLHEVKSGVASINFVLTKVTPNERVRGGRVARPAPEQVWGNTHPGADPSPGMSTDWSEGTVSRSGSDPTRSESPPASAPDRSESPSDPEQLRRRLRRRTDDVERREVEEAVSALEARGGLTEEQRETVRALGSALVEGLTAPPERGLKRAVETARVTERDGERLRAIRRLFDLDEA